MALSPTLVSQLLTQQAPLKAEFERGSDRSEGQGVTDGAPSRGGAGTWGSH